jgi:hypothetical protein
MPPSNRDIIIVRHFLTPGLTLLPPHCFPDNTFFTTFDRRRHPLPFLGFSLRSIETKRSLVIVYRWFYLSLLLTTGRASRHYTPTYLIHTVYYKNDDYESVVSFRSYGLLRPQELGWTAVRGFCLSPSQYVWTYSVAVSKYLMNEANAFGSHSFSSRCMYRCREREYMNEMK